MAFGAGMGETLFGSHIGNVLTKTTIILGIVFLVNTTILAMLGSHKRSSVQTVTAAVPVSTVTTQQTPVPQDPAQLPPSTEQQLPAVDLDKNMTIDVAPNAKKTPATTEVKAPVSTTEKATPMAKPTT